MTATIPARLFQQAKDRPEAPAYFVKSGGAWVGTTWRTYADEVQRAGKSLIALGLSAGSHVCILGFNRPEWAIMDLAAMAIGGAAAGIYTTCSPEEVRYIVHHAEAKVVLVENEAQWRKIAQEKANLPHLAHVVLMKGAPHPGDPLALSWDDFMAKGAEVADGTFDERLASLEPDGLATLIYTSGTTGPPKGVMLSHRNLAWTASTLRELTGGDDHEVSLSYLPLSHIAEQLVTLHGPITGGGSVYFAESIDKVIENLREVRPTLFFGVPRIWEKVHAGLAAKIGGATGLKAKLVGWAMRVGRRTWDRRNGGGAGGGISYALANKLVFSKVKEALGLGRVRTCVSGAAPISRDVIEFFTGIDLMVYEIYGQSEDCGPTTFNLPGKTKIGSVGIPLPGVEVKIAEDGEILVKGPNVFLGYYKEPEATTETLKDGWLYSGDLGAFDPDGFLTITGRKKEIIITSGGKNVAPKNIEAAIKNHPLVAEAVVIGDRRKYLTALVTLDPEAAKQFVAGRGAADQPPHEAPEVRAEVQRAIDEANTQLARVEQVKKFTILPRPFGIDTGELTPTLKVKRKNVHKNFAAEIEQMYADGSEEAAG